MIALRIPKTQYATVSYTRMMSVEMPFAEHNRGAPFGQKNAPAIGLVAAYGSISAGVALGASTFMGGMMIAGGVLSGLGGLTGNKTLSTMGMVAGLAGGLATGITDAATGELMNPFADGFKFADTKMSSIFSGIKESFTPSASSQMTDLAGGNQTGELVDSQVGQNLANEGGNAWNKLDTAGLTNVDGKSTSLVGRAVDTVTDAGSNLLGSGTSSSGTGLLGGLLGSKDMMGMVVGAADSYQRQPLVDSEVAGNEAITAQRQFQTAQAQQRVNNLQNQNVNVASVDPNASIYQTAPAQEGLVTADINGQIMTVPQSQYAAYIRSKQSQQQGVA